ncbi:MAG: ribosomal protein S18-alanine N-acetyltransferase [Zoogloeaceae bacterium]|nr:ribosomal protein S18-alanine N-acetyltransferase [Zoogloeaceae bacterium]
MNLAIRPMQTTDLDWVVTEEQALHPSPWSTGNFEDSMLAGYSCWVASESSDRVAYGILMGVLDEAHLLNLTVAKARQRRGVGRAFLELLCGRARGAGARQMFLEVRVSNLAAQALYRARGFEAIGRRKGYYPGPGQREDAIVMRLAL